MLLPETAAEYKRNKYKWTILYIEKYKKKDGFSAMELRTYCTQCELHATGQ